jgi:cytochrome b pre-mRNA-processing protein 3
MMPVLETLRQSAARKRLAVRLHAAIVERARAQAFFRDFAVPDTLDGRLDLLFLHVWLALDRLKGDPGLSQALTDLLFIGFDEGLRELGAGDIGIGHRIKKISDAYYGRMQAYENASDVDALAKAVERNVYRGAEGNEAHAAALAYYAMAAKTALRQSDPLEGILDFGPMP